MARINFITHNVELWFWTLIINTFGSKSENKHVAYAESTGWTLSKESIVKIVLWCTAGFLIGFIIGVFFL